MPLIKNVLEDAIKQAFDKQAAKQAEGDKPEDSVKEISADLATAIDNYIKSATVTTTFSGTAVAGPYPVAGTATGTIS